MALVGLWGAVPHGNSLTGQAMLFGIQMATMRRKLVWFCLIAVAVVLLINCTIVWLSPGMRFLTKLDPVTDVPGVYGYGNVARRALISRGYHVHGDGRLVLYPDGSTKSFGTGLEIRDSAERSGGTQMCEAIPQECRSGRWEITSDVDGTAILQIAHHCDNGHHVQSRWLATTGTDGIEFWPPGDADIFPELEPVKRLRNLP